MMVSTCVPVMSAAPSAIFLAASYDSMTSSYVVSRKKNQMVAVCGTTLGWSPPSTMM